MEMDFDDDEQFDEPVTDFRIIIEVSVEYILMQNRRLGVEYLSRVYVIFMFQLVLSAAYVLYPSVWWSSIQLSLITSPLVVNVWDFTGLHHFYPFTLAGLLLAEFAMLEYLILTHDIDTILLALILTFVLCTLLYLFTYLTEEVIVLGRPPTKLVVLLLIIIIISYFKKRMVFDFCSTLKNSLAIYYIVFRSYVIRPVQDFEYIHAGTKLHANFLLILGSVITVLNLYL